jgi:hypothetical protein
MVSEAVYSPAITAVDAAIVATLARTSTLATRIACLKRLVNATPRRVGATFPTKPLYWR